MAKHEMDETVCTIRWCVQDVVDALVSSGVDPTDENIDKLLANRFERTLQERSTEEGWEIIDAIIGAVF